MKKILYLSALSIVLFSCSNAAKKENIDDLISTKNVKALNEKKATLQADIAKIEAALATLDVKKEEALVEILTVSDTLFNHYLEMITVFFYNWKYYYI